MWVLLISPRGDVVIMGARRGVDGILCSCANLDDMYEQVAPVSKRTDAVMPLTRNVPYTTYGAAWTSSAVMWLRRPWEADPLYGVFCVVGAVAFRGH